MKIKGKERKREEVTKYCQLKKVGDKERKRNG